jgi:hypothetical protein
LEAAVARHDPATGDDGVVLGVDVARSIAGDRNCLATVRGSRVDSLVTWHSTDTMAVVERVVREVVARGPRQIRADVAGVGAGVVDRLRQLGFDVAAVHFGGAPEDGKRFKNRRAELFWLLRERMETGEATLPDDDDLVADLSALRYFFTADGRIQLESKDAVRKRIGRSPDRADAIALAFSEEPDGVTVEAIIHAREEYLRARASL